MLRHDAVHHPVAVHDKSRAASLAHERRINEEAMLTNPLQPVTEEDLKKVLGFACSFSVSVCLSVSFFLSLSHSTSVHRLFLKIGILQNGITMPSM